MTYNVFGGTLNLTQPNSAVFVKFPVHWGVGLLSLCTGPKAFQGQNSPPSGGRRL